MEELALVAQAKGAAGVRALLRDRVQDAPQLLEQLAQPAPVANPRAPVGAESEAGSERRIRLQQWPLRAQREWWSAAASAPRAAGPAASLDRLARAFLGAAELQSYPDSVCVALARAVVNRRASSVQAQAWGSAAGREGSEPRGFSGEIGKLAFHRVAVALPPLASDDEDDGLEAGDEDGVEVPSAWLSNGNEGSEEKLEGRAPKKPKLGSAPLSDASSKQPSSLTQQSPTLTNEVEDRAVAVGKQLVALARVDHQPTRDVIDNATQKAIAMLQDIVNDVEATHTVSETNFRSLCTMLQLGATIDEVLLNVASALVESSLSSQHAALFVELCVLPKIQRATSVISRLLLQTTLLFGSRYGSILVDALLLPLLSDHENHPIGAPQAEAVTRILRGENAVPSDTIDSFVRRVLEADNTRARGGSSSTPSVQMSAASPQPHLLTSEPALLVFQNLFASRPVLSSTTVEQYVTACEYALDGPDGEQLLASLKFATALFTLISKYPEQCSAHVEALEAINKRLTSLMARTTMRFIQKLKR